MTLVVRAATEPCDQDPIRGDVHAVPPMSWVRRLEEQRKSSQDQGGLRPGWQTL